MTDQQSVSPLAADPDDRGCPTGLTVLVVEDDVDTASSTATILERHGHEVQVAHDGPTALDAALERQPDVVLLDIGIPLLDGYEVAKVLHPHDPHGRRPLLIVITGREEDRRRSIEAGIDLHMLKPMDTDLLLHILKRFHRVIMNTFGG